MAQYGIAGTDGTDYEEPDYGNGRQIGRGVIDGDTGTFTVRILRKVGYSWQRTGLDIIVDLNERTARNERGGLVVEWCLR